MQNGEIKMTSLKNILWEKGTHVHNIDDEEHISESSISPLPIASADLPDDLRKVQRSLGSWAKRGGGIYDSQNMKTNRKMCNQKT